MYNHFLSLDFWRYEDKETSDLYERAQNFSQFFSWIFDGVSRVFTQVIIVITGVAALIAVNAWLALVVFIAVIPSIYVQFRLSRLQISQWNENVDTRRQLNMIEWNLFRPENIAELRLYGLVRHFLTFRQKLRDKDEKERIEFQKKFLPRQVLSHFLQSFVEIGALVWVTLEIAAKSQPIGQFVYVQQVASRVFSGINGFISTLSSIDEDVANLFDYTRFMELEELSANGKALRETPQKIEVKGVYFQYPQQETVVLKDISLTIRQHEHVAIVGENGAGKSTLIKLISGLYMPTKGEILLDGVATSDVSIQDWHRALSVLSQDFIQYRFTTARDNVLYGDINKNDTEAYDEALNAAEASGFVKKLSNGDKTYMDIWVFVVIFQRMLNGKANLVNDISVLIFNAFWINSYFRHVRSYFLKLTRRVNALNSNCTRRL
jgi:ATP-binding cassette subfamily B protein/ATP-binding cassette subfamily C protein